MFTGIITAVGTVRSASSGAASSPGRTIVIEAPWSDVELGESVAVNGACLTVTERGDGWFSVHVIATSLDRTTFDTIPGGCRVNLERALRASDRLGGHLVQGHVDGVGTVDTVSTQGDARLLTVRVPADVAAVTIPLGSITVDGVSLTVNGIPAPGVVQVSLIPFTLEHTTLGERVAGDRVHLEGDLVGKYVKQLTAAWRAEDRR
jgi:riboflavin synthase